MKIEGPRPTTTTKSTEKTRKSGGSGSVFQSYLEADAGETQAPAGPSALGGVGSVFAAQTFEDPAEKKSRKRMIERAGGVLAALDTVRTGLLTGTLQIGHMAAIKGAIREGREKIMDPVLAGLLDDVDLRAQVELAKLEMFYEKSKINKEP